MVASISVKRSNINYKINFDSKYGLKYVVS